MKRLRRFPACILEWQDSCHICFWIKALLVSFLRDYCNIFMYPAPPILTEFFHRLHLFSWDPQLYSQWDTLHSAISVGVLFTSTVQMGIHSPKYATVEGKRTKTTPITKTCLVGKSTKSGSWELIEILNYNNKPTCKWWWHHIPQRPNWSFCV